MIELPSMTQLRSSTIIYKAEPWWTSASKSFCVEWVCKLNTYSITYFVSNVEMQIKIYKRIIESSKGKLKIGS